MNSELLHRYWYKFGKGEARVGLGVGVTAYDRPDAERLVQQIVFDGGNVPEIVELIEDVDVSTLDHNHVLPNMFPPSFRGVWFPKITMGIQ